MKVLILSVPAGGGHLQTAKALYDYLNQQESTECRILDIAENVNDLAAQILSDGYLFASTHMTKGYRMVYNKMDKRTKKSFTTTSKMLYKICKNKLFNYIEGFSPDVIVSTHVFATICLNVHQKKHKVNAKIISIVTDFTVHPMWEQTTSDYYIIASENLTPVALKKLGTAENVLPLGIPIKEEFSHKISKQDARKILGHSDKFTVLVMMGSMGYANAAVEIIEQLDTLDDDFSVVAVCGSNKALKEKLDALPFKKELKVYGFCDNVSLLMDSCDCIVTKPGGLSTSEAMAKGIPIILASPIPGQEERNLEFMQSNGVAMSLSNEFTVDKAVGELMHNPDVKEKLIENTKRLAKPYSTRDLAGLIYDIIN